MKIIRLIPFVLCVTPMFAQSVERGQYLATVGGCGDCHTRLLSGSPSNAATPSKPKKPGEVVSSAGAFYGPWGISYAANLTPDPTTGILKEYSEASFIHAMRTGKTPDGGTILPPMPWENYGKMTDDDLKSLWAYLHSLKPVKNKVKPPVRTGKGK